MVAWQSFGDKLFRYMVSFCVCYFFFLFCRLVAYDIIFVCVLALHCLIFLLALFWGVWVGWDVQVHHPHILFNLHSIFVFLLLIFFFFLPVLTCSFGGSLCFLSAPLHWWQCLCILSALLHWWLFCLLFVFPSSMVALFLFFVCLSSLVAVLQPQLKPCLCRKESVRGFYKGFSPYMIHVTPNICIVFLLYELMTNTRQEPSITFKTEVAEVSDSVWVFLFALNLGFWAVFCIVFGDV